MTLLVLFLRHHPCRAYCVLRAAVPDRTDRRGYITSLCLYAFPYDAVELRTAPVDGPWPLDTCPACRVELAARTQGAAVPVEPSRTVTPMMRGGRDVERVIRASEWAAPEIAIEDIHSGAVSRGVRTR